MASMATLRGIDATICEVIERGLSVDEETGELFDTSDLDSLQVAYKDKINACGCYIKELTYTVDALKAEEKVLTDRRRILEKKVERMKEYVLSNMGNLDGGKLETPQNKISVRASKRVEIIDESAIPEEYWRVKREIDKTKIGNAIKSGEHVEGAVIAINENLQIK